MKEPTLIELIEEIVTENNLFKERNDMSSIKKINDCALILSDRLSCSNVAAISFAFIISEAAWGRMPTRSDVMQFLPPDTSIVERLECIWELLDKKLVLLFKPARNPIRHFFIDQDVAEKIVANKVPLTKKVSLLPDHEDRLIKIKPCTGGKDYEIQLEGAIIGIILLSAIGDVYEAYWEGLLVHASYKLSNLVEWLNEAYDNGTLKSSQI